MSTGKEGGARGKKKREAEAEEGGIVTKVCRELFTGSTSRLLITGGGGGGGWQKAASFPNSFSTLKSTWEESCDVTGVIADAQGPRPHGPTAQRSGTHRTAHPEKRRPNGGWQLRGQLCPV